MEQTFCRGDRTKHKPLTQSWTHQPPKISLYFWTTTGTKMAPDIPLLPRAAAIIPFTSSDKLCNGMWPGPGPQTDTCYFLPPLHSPHL
uniref:Uncharacterized protein n=1 Tax=Amphiprion ocellaris TaxID=80972 RepID=A0AAQ6A3K4_AMPOC